MSPSPLSVPLALALLAVGGRAGAQQVDTLRYSFEYRASGGQPPSIAVTLQFRGDPSGRTRIVLPGTWAGETGLGAAVSVLDAGPGVTVGPAEGDERTLVHRSRAPVTVRYVLHQDWAGGLRYPVFHRVLIDGSRVAFNQTNALVYPEHVAGSTVLLQVQWSGLPDDWRIVSSVGSKAWCSVPMSWRELSAAFFAAGDFRLVAPPSAMDGITIATQGRWRFSDGEFARLVASLWRAETAFWQGPAFDRAFVLLLPLADTGTVAGTAFAAGFFAVSDTAATLEPIGRLLAHELFHLWNGQRMTAAADEVPYKWFTEGITDYYADRFFRAVGQYSDSAYRGRVNAVLREYYASPARRSTRAAVAARYWTDAGVQQYPYAQGYVFALYLEANLPVWSGGTFDLDSLMDGAYRETAPRGIDLSDALLARVVPPYARGAFTDALRQFIDGGAMIPAAPAALGRCAAVREVVVRSVDRGMFVVPQYVTTPQAPGCLGVGP